MSAAGSALGRVAGWAIAPFFGLTSLARHARTFHPRGAIFHAAVAPHGDVRTSLVPLAERLAGRALVRFSGALWKHAEGLDVLGCALRLRRDETETPEAAPEDQDLLFATILRPWTMPLAPFFTNAHDYLGNDYFAVSPFDAGLGYPIYLRLHPMHPSDGAVGSREERLEHEVEARRGVLRIDVGERPFGPWAPLLVVSLERVANVDGEALRFRPFRAGRGVRPRGFVHALRRGVYAVSQLSRPAHAV